jgi:NDP-sugar pyrophosphorylase family protein
VAGVEPLYHALFQLERLGIRRVVVNSHYLSEKIESALRDWAHHFPKTDFRISKEVPEILGTGGAILKIVQENQDWFHRSSLLLQNGDTLSSVGLEALVAPDENRFGMSFNAHHLARYNPLWIDKNQHYAGLGKTAPAPDLRPAHFLGLHHLNVSAVEAISQSKDFPVRFVDLFHGLYRPLMDRGHDFRGVEFFKTGSQDYWFDMTTAEYLLEAQRHVLSQLLSNVGRDDSKDWSRVLLHRYPSIECREPGVWSTEKPNSQLSFRAPAVFVQSLSTTSEDSVRLAAIQVGPHASLVFENGFFQWDPKQTVCQIENSVVFGVRGVRVPIEKALKDSIFVL